MRTLPGAEMTREDMREEKRDEGENALASKGRLGRYEGRLLPITSPNTE